MRYILTIIFFLFTVTVNAADYHVAKTGNDSTGDGSLGSPWLTPEHGAGELSANDTLYIHVGTYNVDVDTTGNIKPLANGCTITNYESDVVIIDGGTFPTGIVIALNGYDDLTLDGLTVKGAINVNSCDSATIKNCDLSVGGDNWAGSYFGEVIFIENTTNVLIQNNKIHDNDDDPRSSEDNSPLIQEYDSTGLIIEYNNFYNSYFSAIRLKDNAHDSYIRFNYFYDNGQADIQGGNQDQGDNVKIYQNIFRNSSGVGRYGAVALEYYNSNWQVYNNTFVDSGSGITDGLDGGGTQTYYIWNNIFYNVGQYNILSGSSPYHIQYCNYNQFYGTGDWKHNGTEYTSLATWQSASSYDANSITTDPGFDNASGTDPEDFKRSSYPTDGRGGVYEDVIGAYITGNETIGYTANGAPEVSIGSSCTSATITSGVVISN